VIVSDYAFYIQMVQSHRMEGIVSRVFAWLFAFAIGAAACDSPAAPAPSVSESVELSVTVSDVVIRTGQRITISVSALNRADSEVLLPIAQCMPLMYRVYNSEGEVVSPYAGVICGHIGPAPQRVLSSGSTITMTHFWSPYYNYGASGSAEHLPPGRYGVAPILVSGSDVLKEGA
jgi:hypothetical protein